MNEEENNEFRNMMSFFERVLFGRTAVEQRSIPKPMPTSIGVCNCCLMKDKGHFVMYIDKSDGEEVRLFVCLVCLRKCKPDEFCTIRGDLKITHEKYVTNQN